MLARHNPRQALYIGRALWVKPQRGPQQKELPFAHGGSGVLLSRALAAKLQPVLEVRGRGRGRVGVRVW
jgi:hypothetical protein